jgi:anaerobic magnesium-protoporphyrin IX monomethyl ester cyclase
MTVALVYPPTCDPTAPYLAVPMLTGFLRAHGVAVLPIDANLEAFDQLLEPGPLARIAERIERGIAELEQRGTLGHEEQLRYVALQRARADARAVPHGIAEAKAILRDEARFFDERSYDSATRTVDAALRAISAAHHPLHLDFTAYRTPFGLLSQEEIRRMSEPAHDPFDAYVEETLIPRLRESGATLVGLSVCFPGQLQPAYAFAWKIKRALPHVHLTAGGPGLTQMMIRLRGRELAEALGPFDSAVVFEGEHTLLHLARALEGPDPRAAMRAIPNLVLRDPLLGARFVAGHGMEDLRALPAPDFDGLPLDRYLSPRLTLPYDPTRGCYWGKCTFCHYGLAEVGTAEYRERDVAAMIGHLEALSKKYGTQHFYFSQDSVAPKTLLKLADALIASGLDLRWGTDLKPEKYLTPARAETLKRAGAVACALGVESGNERVLRLIDKGAPVAVVSDVIDRLSRAGVAAEAMCFTDFPTETREEALDTLRFLDDRSDQVATYIVGEFGLTHGSLVAQEPSRFGVREVWQLDGDRLGLSLFFAPETPWKDEEDRAVIDDELGELSRGWTLRPYPWAGAVSTAHTLLHYARFGAAVFRARAAAGVQGKVLGATRFDAVVKFDLRRTERAEACDAQIWTSLVHDERRVSHEAYTARATAAPRAKPLPMTYRFASDASPVRSTATPRGRRPSHAHNAARR